MDNSHHHSNSNLKRLTMLSKNVNDAINEIFVMAFAQAHQQPASPGPDCGFDIKLIDRNLWINSIMIPLVSRDRTLDLVQAFFRSESLTLSKAEIIAAVYKAEEHHSSRYRDSIDTRLNKLLSRTRKFLRESLEPVHLPFQLEWLVWDGKVRKYCLYSVRTEFLKLH